jgi:hypothetical protein
MANRRSAGKIQPAPLTLAIDPPSVAPATTTSFYVDLSQCASILNRRFYRQGLNWAVSGFKVISSQGSQGAIAILKIPSTWMASNAWEKVFRTWKRQQDQAIAESGSQSAVAKFRDFKIHLNEGHVDAGFAANLTPDDHALLGEWDASEIVIPNLIPDASGSDVDPAEYLLHMVGVNNHVGVSRGMLDGYANSRAYPQSPDPVAAPVENTANFLRQMFDVGNDSSEIVNNAVNMNDDLPYDQTEYPGGGVQAPTAQIHDLSYITATSVGGMTFLKGGMFPCGLIQINVQNTGDSGLDVALLVELVPGPNRGYLTQPMTDM